MAGGRPTKYTPEMVEYICNAIASSNYGIAKLCKLDDKLPCHDTICEWMTRYDEFSDIYLLARKKQAHHLANQVKDFADEIDNFVYEDEDGVKRIDSGMIAAQNFKMKANTWLASRLRPDLYAENKPKEEEKQNSDAMLEELKKLRAELAEKNKKEF